MSERPTGSRRWRRPGALARRLGRLLFGLLLAWEVGFAALDRCFPFPAAAFGRYGTSPIVRAADGTPMHVGLTARDERLIPHDLDEVSSHVIHAVVASEDRRFHRHGGVDPRAVARALWANAAGGAGRQGASTITMQLARLVDPQPRTLAGKAVQAFRALQLEQRYDKPFLLARYLDLVPFGGNVRGVGAAAETFFGTPARALTAAQAALLVSLLPAPSRFSPWRNEAQARLRRNRVLDAMRSEGFLDGREHAAACAEPLGLRAGAHPDVAPHAWLRAAEGRTSIDPVLQRAVEDAVLGAGGVDGLGVVVVENATLAVRALAGAAQPDARVLDATQRPRSAGSTLKPFLYALALDRGLVALDTPLLDLPWHRPDWSPSNFDETFRGPVAARTALADSLNLPAVRLAAALPPGAFLATLRAAGFGHLRVDGTGRAVDLALGTDDVTAMELAGAYAALANGGRFRPPWIAEARRTDATEGSRVCSPGAAALVTAALSDATRARPAGAARAGVAWKTGTSSNRRDAWAAGYSARWTVVVWRGRLDGQPHPDLVGARAAVPLFFAVLHAVDPAPAPFPAPAGVASATVCAASGLRSTDACAATGGSLVPAEAARLRPCGMHRTLIVDATTGRLRCATCRGRHAATERTFLLVPPEQARWRRQAGEALDVLPPHAADCPAPLEPPELRPVFLRPLHGQRFVAAAGRALVGVQAEAPPGEGPLTFLVDGRPAEAPVAGAPRSVELAPGSHVLTLSTPRGLATRVRVTVEPPR